MNHMGTERWIGVAAGAAVGLGVLFYLYGPAQLRWPLPSLDLGQWFQDDEGESVQAPVAPEPPTAMAETPAPGPVYPVPQAPEGPPDQTAPDTPAPSPGEAATDRAATAAAARVFGEVPVEAFLIPERVIQSVVATVDSLDRDPIPLRFRAIREVPDVPIVEQDGDRLVLSTDNDERYRLLAGVLRNTSARDMAQLYLRYYPLMEKAYRDMGYPQGHFNDRVIGIIDHLLEAPVVEHPIELVRPKVLYAFADAELEDLSSGQKIMVRIGPANATAAKERLRELRAILAAGRVPATQG